MTEFIKTPKHITRIKHLLRAFHALLHLIHTSTEVAADICILQIMTLRLREKYLPKTIQVVRKRPFREVWGTGETDRLGFSAPRWDAGRDTSLTGISASHWGGGLSQQVWSSLVHERGEEMW